MKNLLESKQAIETVPEGLEELKRSGLDESVMKRLRNIAAVFALAVAQVNCGAGKPMVANIDNIELNDEASKFWGVKLPPQEVIRSIVKKKINVGGPNYFWKLPEEQRKACDFGMENSHLAHQTTAIGGLGDLRKHLPEEEMKIYLKDYLQFFPGTSTSKAGLSSIMYTNLDSTSPYPGLEGVISRAVFSRESRTIKINLKQALKSEDEFMEIVMRSIPHEIGHSIDFASNTKLNPGQNLEMLYIILNLLESEARPKFGYVESIKSEEKEKQNLVLYGKAVEYFAELTRVALNSGGEDWDSWGEIVEEDLRKSYLASPEEAKRNTEFIKNLLLFMDGQFEPWHAYEKRKSIGDKLAEKMAEEKRDKELASQ
ncbi:MAG: hypothetical protein ACRCZE_05250 [Candidatus Altimarinota bacterium]